MSDLAAILRRITDDPRNRIRSADKLLIEEAARELDMMSLTVGALACGRCGRLVTYQNSITCEHCDAERQSEEEYR